MQPIVAAEEKEERERQERVEAERIGRLRRSREETVASINRVHEHFKKMSRFVPSLNDDPTTNSLAGPEVISSEATLVDTILVPEVQSLSQIHGKKRKRQLSPETVRPHTKIPQKALFKNSNRRKR